MTADTVLAWIAETKAAGRVTTRYPRGLLKGQLASRARAANPALIEDANDPTGWNEWDYQLAPFVVRMADNLDDVFQELTQGATVKDYVEDTAEYVGDVVHEVFKTAASAAAHAIGIPPWALWAGLAVGAYVIVRNPPRARAYLRSWTA